MTDIFTDLSAEFPKQSVSWRAQSVTKDGSKALALAYIDSRDVQERLDKVVGPQNWQDRYEVHGAKTICYLSIRIDGEWVTKADGAGDTAVEAEKGSISDSFKRAAVKWGIGRYLYALEAPWVPCECSEYNGKKQWKRWTSDPWNFVKGATDQPPKNDAARALYAALEKSMRQNKTRSDLAAWWKDSECKEKRAKLPIDWQQNLKNAFADYGNSLPEDQREAA